MKNLINQGILAFGGLDGGIISDGSTSTATLTGLEAVWIEVNSATTFESISGYDQINDTAYTYGAVNVPTGVEIALGTRFGAGYGKIITDIVHGGGQLSYYTAKPD